MRFTKSFVSQGRNTWLNWVRRPVQARCVGSRWPRGVRYPPIRRRRIASPMLSLSSRNGSGCSTSGFRGPTCGPCAIASRGSTAIRATGSCLAGSLSRTTSPRWCPDSSASRPEGCRSQSSDLPACPTKSPTRSCRCWPGSRSRSRSGVQASMKSMCCAKKLTATFRRTTGRPLAGQAGDRADRKEGSEIWRIARRRHAAALGTRSDGAVAMFHVVRHAARQ